MGKRRCLLCASAIAEDNGGTAPFTCAECGAVFQSSGAPPAVQEPMPPVPNTFTVAEDAGQISIRWPEQSGGAVMIVFTVFFLATAWYVLGCPTTLDPSLFDPSLFDPSLLFFAPFFLVPLAIVYGGIVSLVNHRELVVGGGRLRFRSRPLPTSGGIDLDATELEQLFVRRRTWSGKHGTHTEHLLCAVTDRGTRPILPTPRRDEALYLERAIERHLGIADQPTAVIPRPRGVAVTGKVGPVDERGMPEGDARGAVTIAWRWWGRGLPNDAVLGLFALVFLFSTLAPLLAGGAGVYRSLLIAVSCIALTYWLVGRVFNRTTISLRPGRLEVRHGPLPWVGNVSFDASTIRQALVRPGMTNDRKLWADVGGFSRTIASHGAPDELVYAEQVIERYLGIVDDPSANNL